LCANTNKLIPLATKEFGSLTKAEMILFSLVAISSFVDFSAGSIGETNPAKSDQWGEERVLKASRIAWLCKNREAASLVGNRGLDIIGARIEDQLDLAYIKVPFVLILRNCSIPLGLYLRGSKFGEVSLESSHIGSINAGHIKVTRSFLLRNTRIVGSIDLVGAKIDGNLECGGGHFINKGKQTINAQDLKVGGDVQLNDGFISEGEIDLSKSKINGDLQLENAKLVNNGMPTLIAQQAIIKGNILMGEKFFSDGLVDLRVGSIGDGIEAQEANSENSDYVATKGIVVNLLQKKYLKKILRDY
jgi:hypothetical protein